MLFNKDSFTEVTDIDTIKDLIYLLLKFECRQIDRPLIVFSGNVLSSLQLAKSLVAFEDIVEKDQLIFLLKPETSN